MHSTARRWSRAFNRAEIKQDELRTLQDELEQSLLEGVPAEAEETILLLQRKGYSLEQITEFLSSSPKPEPP